MSTLPFTLTLDAGHGEYVPRDYEVVFQPLGDEWIDMHPLGWPDEAAAAKVAELAPGVDVYDPTWCMVIRLTGTVPELDAAFGRLLDQVRAEPSGDDDTFDYWPSGARLLLSMARDLDRIDGGDRLTLAVAAVLQVFVWKAEFADELRDKIPALRAD